MAAMEPRYWNRQTLKRNREGRRGKRTRKTHAIVPPHRAQSAAEVDITRDGQFLLGEGAAGRRLRRRSPRDRPRRGKTAILFHRRRGVLPDLPRGRHLVRPIEACEQVFEEGAKRIPTRDGSKDAIDRQERECHPFIQRALVRSEQGQRTNTRQQAHPAPADIDILTYHQVQLPDAITRIQPYKFGTNFRDSLGPSPPGSRPQNVDVQNVSRPRRENNAGFCLYRMRCTDQVRTAPPTEMRRPPNTTLPSSNTNMWVQSMAPLPDRGHGSPSGLAFPLGVSDAMSATLRARLPVRATEGGLNVEFEVRLVKYSSLAPFEPEEFGTKAISIAQYSPGPNVVSRQRSSVMEKLAGLVPPMPELLI